MLNFNLVTQKAIWNWNSEYIVWQPFHSFATTPTMTSLSASTTVSNSYHGCSVYPIFQSSAPSLSKKEKALMWYLLWWMVTDLILLSASAGIIKVYSVGSSSSLWVDRVPLDRMKLKLSLLPFCALLSKPTSWLIVFVLNHSWRIAVSSGNLSQLSLLSFTQTIFDLLRAGAYKNWSQSFLARAAICLLSNFRQMRLSMLVKA